MFIQLTSLFTYAIIDINYQYLRYILIILPTIQEGEPTMLSIVIPTHNRQDYLEKTLIALSNQTHADKNDFEVIVIDDASIDDTENTVKYYIDKMSLHYIKIESSNGNPSLVRNVGIKNAKGDLISFIDSGVVMNCDFVSTILHKYSNSDNYFVIHEIYGLFADVSETMKGFTTELLSAPNSQTFTEFLSKYSASSKWIDRRKELFASDHVYTPWCYAWSCALTVSKKIIDKSGLFDESFKGWGSEDVDFAYSCYLNGGNFIFDGINPLFHIPHPTASNNQKEKSNRDNRLIMHQKTFSFETEIFLYTFSTHMQAIMSFYDNLILRHVLPEYPNKLWGTISEYCNGSIHNKILFVGASTSEALKSIKSVSNAFYVNKKQKSMIECSDLNIELENQLGCSTKYSSKYFDAIIITDIYRILTDTYLIPFSKEMERIGKRVYLTYNNSYIPYGVNMYGLLWRDINDIKNILPQNLSLNEVERISDNSVYSLNSDIFQNNN